MKNTITTIQLTNVEGEPIGIYITLRTDTEAIQEEFDMYFRSGEANDEDDILEFVDEQMEKEGVYRAIAEEVTTNII